MMIYPMDILICLHLLLIWLWMILISLGGDHVKTIIRDCDTPWYFYFYDKCDGVCCSYLVINTIGESSNYISNFFSPSVSVTTH